jgi:hypothetical protein
MAIRQLHEILSAVTSRAGSEFSGIGIILADYPERLPLFPLRLDTVAALSGELTSDLVSISNKNSDYHDGFHVISSSWKLTRISQYFSPNILPEVWVNRSRRFGGRYMAALFGSALPDVIATGIASRGFGIAVFRSGVEVTFESDA